MPQHNFLISRNGYYYARMQDDGNLVVYNGNDFNSKNAVWASNTGGKGQGPFKLVTQTDGNLVIYQGNGQPTWDSGTWNKGTAPFQLIMQDDRNLVLYDKNFQATWSSDTWTGDKPSNDQFGKQHRTNTLHDNYTLHQNEFITSSSGKYFCRMQDDGNLVVYNGHDWRSNHAAWASNTGGKGYGPYKLVMQNDGNLVIYESNGNPIWASNTWQKGQAPHKLVMQDDRNLVIYDATGKATWATASNA